MGFYEFDRDDAFRFAREQGIKYQERGDELILRECPYCHGKGRSNKDKFSINLNTGQFQCFRAGCGAHGNMITLAKDFDFDLGTDVNEYYRPTKQYRKLNQPAHPIEPKEPAIEYLEGRGIPEEVAKRYEITTQTGHDNILAFPFYDENGVFVFAKYRKTDFDKTKDSSKEWCEADCKPILFGMKQCVDFDRLVITEGQMDSLSVAAAGIDNAVSVPTGANGFTWIPYCWNWVIKFDTIVVFGDYEHDHMTLLDEISHRFPNKIKHVREEDYHGCKDANEILQKYGKEVVRAAVEHAESMPVSNVIKLSEVEDQNIYDVEKLRTGINELDKLLCGGLPFGAVCLLGGKRGDGKSTFASQIMANAIDQGYSTFAYSGEMPNSTYKNWFEFQVAGPDNIIENKTDYGTVRRFISTFNEKRIRDWYNDKAYIYDNRIAGTDEVESIIDTATHCIMQYGVRVILIDNLMTAMFAEPNNGDASKYDMQSTFVQKLTRLALEYNCLIILVAHSKKNDTGDVNDDISGSGDITNFASITMSYSRDTKLPEDERRLKLAKNRLIGKTNLSGIIIDYDEKSKRMYGPGDDVNRKFGWETDEDGFIEVEDIVLPFD